MEFEALLVGGVAVLAVVCAVFDALNVVSAELGAELAVADVEPAAEVVELRTTMLN